MLWGKDKKTQGVTSKVWRQTEHLDKNMDHQSGNIEGKRGFRVNKSQFNLPRRRAVARWRGRIVSVIGAAAAITRRWNRRWRSSVIVTRWGRGRRPIISVISIVTTGRAKVTESGWRTTSRGRTTPIRRWRAAPRRWGSSAAEIQRKIHVNILQSLPD